MVVVVSELNGVPLGSVWRFTSGVAWRVSGFKGTEVELVETESATYGPAWWPLGSFTEEHCTRIDTPQPEAKPRESPAPHDFSDPYCVVVNQLDGEKDITRLCVACGAQQGSTYHIDRSCRPEPGWREKHRAQDEDCNATLTATLDAKRRRLSVAASPLCAPPEPSRNGLGALAGRYRYETGRRVR